MGDLLFGQGMSQQLGKWARDTKASEQHFLRERATGIEPAFSAWEADVLPLNYARATSP